MRGVRGDAERPGECRNVQNFIGSSHDIRQARFVPPPVDEMRRCLEKLEIHMNEAGGALPHLVRVALVHYQFETIHPFRDGNGRVGRLIVPLLLCSYERLEGPTLYLSPYLNVIARSTQTSSFASVRLVTLLLGFAFPWKPSMPPRRSRSNARKRCCSCERTYRQRLQLGRASVALLALVDGLSELPSVSLGQAAKAFGWRRAGVCFSQREEARRCRDFTRSDRP